MDSVGQWLIHNKDNVSVHVPFVGPGIVRMCDDRSEIMILNIVYITALD